MTDHLTQPFQEPDQLPAAAAAATLPDPEPEPAAAADTAAADGPVPLLKGAFAVYLTPQHSLVLAYRPEGETDTKQFVVPSFVVDMAARQSGQSPAAILSRLKEGI
jgi:hypothetical protein